MIESDPSYFRDDMLTLLLGDARKVLPAMDAGSANCVVTSPPYFGLRDYEGNPDQIGAEESPAEYVAALVEVFTEAHRVLADDGTLWLNLGDSYAHPPGSAGRQGNGARTGRTFTAEGLRGTRVLPSKNLLLIPEQVIIALQQQGWIVRSKIVWHKQNAMPESVKDRPSRRYELLFLLTKSPRYWFNLDPIREPYSENKPWGAQNSNKPGEATALLRGQRPDQHQTGLLSALGEHPLGRQPGDVWTFPVGKLTDAHTAAFPLELPRRCILAGCRPGGTVLDPFSGAGTTAVAAQQVGRRAIGIDINAKYHDIALRRMTDAPLPLLDAEDKSDVGARWSPP